MGEKWKQVGNLLLLDLSGWWINKWQQGFMFFRGEVVEISQFGPLAVWHHLPLLPPQALQKSCLVLPGHCSWGMSSSVALGPGTKQEDIPPKSMGCKERCEQSSGEGAVCRCCEQVQQHHLAWASYRGIPLFNHLHATPSLPKFSLPCFLSWFTALIAACGNACEQPGSPQPDFSPFPLALFEETTLFVSVWCWDSDATCVWGGFGSGVHNLSLHQVLATNAKQMMVLWRQHSSRGYRCSDQASVCVHVYMTFSGFLYVCLLRPEQAFRRGILQISGGQQWANSTWQLVCPSSSGQRIFLPRAELPAWWDVDHGL